MSVEVSSKSLLPVRRDKQVATGINVSGGMGGFGGNGGGQPPVYTSIINGTPVVGQVAVFHDASSIEGDARLFWDKNAGRLYVNLLSSFGTDNFQFYTDGQLQFVSLGWATFTSATDGFIFQGPVIGLGFIQDVLMHCNTAYETNGFKLTLAGSDTATYAGANLNGGDVHIQGGQPTGTGTTGNVFIGTGSAGTNPLPAAGVSDTCILTYNPTTGQLSYLAI